MSARGDRKRRERARHVAAMQEEPQRTIRAMTGWQRVQWERAGCPREGLGFFAALEH